MNEQIAFFLHPESTALSSDTGGWDIKATSSCQPSDDLRKV